MSIARIWTKPVLSTGAAAVLLLAAGCQNAGPNTQAGTAIGAATGAVLGAVIGHQSGEEGEGAVLGAAAGAAVGAAIGSNQDEVEEDRRRMEMEGARMRAAERAQHEKEVADAQRRRLIASGARIDDPELMAARQRAEAAEAELARVRKEQDDAMRKAKQLAEYEARERAAREEIARMKNQDSPPATATPNNSPGG